jgi:tRNA pseudouridine55 synthase
MISDTSLSGILLVHKPVGPTSFQVVSRVRRIFGVKKAGHCGTLDPFASGVLPVCIGKATRVVRYMDSYDKEYRCTVRFGSYTDTQDREGRLIGGREPSAEEMTKLIEEDYRPIRDLILSLPGELEQVPPMYSAVKIDGRPLYEYARKGITVVRQARLIRVFSSTVHGVSSENGLTADFTVACSKGTYIRTLCEMLGEKSGFGAHAQELCRTRCGPFSLQEAYTLDDLESMRNREELMRSLLSESSALTRFKQIRLTEEEAEHVRHGRQMDLSLFEERLREAFGEEETDSRICVYFNEAPLAVVFPDEKDGRQILRIERMFS